MFSNDSLRMFPKRLVFCGGGTRCLVFLKTLTELEQRGRLAHVQEYWGTSAGALLAALMALTRSAVKVKETMYAADYLKFRDIDVGNLININKTWGMDDARSLTGEIERLFEMFSPGSKEKRLCDISGLNVVVADLNDHQTLVCNGSNYPNLRAVEAVRASMSLPIFFRPYYHAPTGHHWVDGGLRANFPWDLLPDDVARQESLGFMIEKGWAGGPKSFTDYLFSLIHFDEPRKLKEWKERWPGNIIWYPSLPFPAWFMRLQKDDYALIERMSAEAADRWFTDEARLLPKTPENPTPSEAPCIPVQVFPQHRTNELSGNLKLLSLPSQDSFPLQSPHTQSSSRRWSV